MEKIVKVPAESAKPVSPVPAEPVVPQASPDLVKTFPKKNNTMLVNTIVSLLVVLAGVGTGWAITKTSAASPETKMDSSAAVESAATGAVELDETQFNETAEGMLIEGGIDGEGTHHLDRDLGEEKYVYLISSVIDLQSFVGKKVEVRGKSVAGQNAGWLMDVAKVKVLE